MVTNKQTMGVFMLAVLFSLVCSCLGVNPGFRTTITGKGLDYGECFEFIYTLIANIGNLYHIETVNYNSVLCKLF